jgi:hypothetical protein
MKMIGSNAMLVDLNISMWTGRKMDKKVSEEIDVSKSTKARAGNYNKKLLAGSDKLEKVQKIATAVRTWNYQHTLPWSDGGSRLLPMKSFFDYKATLGNYEQQYNDAVEDFLTEYPQLVSGSAFTLGALFDRGEYPDVEDLRSKFRFKYVFCPVPDAGDFRIDVEEQAKNELQQQYKEYYDGKLADAMKDAWDRLHETLTHLSDRMDYTDENKKKFWDSTITNASDLCGLLTSLNVTNDPKLEDMRQKLEKALNGVDASDIRESEAIRTSVKSKVDDILSMF